MAWASDGKAPQCRVIATQRERDSVSNVRLGSSMAGGRVWRRWSDTSIAIWRGVR